MDGKGNSRLQYIDVLKGIAIILVLIGHRSVNEYVTVFIYMFHMPLFFFHQRIFGSYERNRDEDGIKEEGKASIISLCNFWYIDYSL